MSSGRQETKETTSADKFIEATKKVAADPKNQQVIQEMLTSLNRLLKDSSISDDKKMVAIMFDDNTLGVVKAVLHGVKSLSDNVAMQMDKNNAVTLLQSIKEIEDLKAGAKKTQTPEEKLRENFGLAVQALETCGADKDPKNREKNIDNLARRLQAVTTAGKLNPQVERELKKMVNAFPDAGYREALLEAYQTSTYLTTPAPPTSTAAMGRQVPELKVGQPAPQGQRDTAKAFQQPAPSAPPARPAANPKSDWAKQADAVRDPKVKVAPADEPAPTRRSPTITMGRKGGTS